MQWNLLWTGREYYSLENCLVNHSEKGALITSTIVGYYNNTIYKVDYLIETNRNWETIRFEIESRHNNQLQSIKYEGDGKGNWRNEQGPADQFTGCIDVDIPLTPFTNTLPINRLGLARNEQRAIRVLYVDLLEGQLRPAQQQYTRLGDTAWHYENVPNDFEATIEVDEWGFVIDYPSLFVRTASLETHYR